MTVPSGIRGLGFASRGIPFAEDEEGLRVPADYLLGTSIRFAPSA